MTDQRARNELEHLCLKSLLETTEERFFFKDRESRFFFVSAGYTEAVMPGLMPQDMIGMTNYDVFGAEAADAMCAEEQLIIKTGVPLVKKIKHEANLAPGRAGDVWVSVTKEPLYAENGEIIGIWGHATDVTSQVQAEHKLDHQALHDSLTGLINREAFMDRLKQALAMLREPGAKRLGLFLIDVDNFQDLNDSAGFAIGDKVLMRIGERLSSLTNRITTVARFSGDEFAILCPGLKRAADVRQIGNSIIDALSVPIQLDGLDLAITVSMGAVVTADPHDTPPELLRRAEAAMNPLRRVGPLSHFDIFNSETHVRDTARALLAADLRKAVDRQELFVVYQPVVSVETQEIVGAEALVRWQHQERGFISPEQFIPLAEERGMIHEIDDFVLNEACRQLAQWSRDKADWSEFVMSVNVSAYEISDPALVGRVEAALKRHKIAPHQLCLEITETVLITEAEDADRVINSLTKLGVQIALDDFGTGHSTLTHLQQLNIQKLKIDRSFIAELCKGERNYKIIAAVIAMAHALNITVVAEGIETTNQLEKLLDLHCGEGQGYVFAAPLPADELVAKRNLALAANSVRSI